MKKFRFMRWLAVATTGTFFLWGSGGCLPENFWAGFLGDTIISGVGAVLVATALGG